MSIQLVDSSGGASFLPDAFTDFCLTLLQVGRTVVENKTADISETRKLVIRRKGSGPRALNHDTNGSSPQQPPQNQADQETQLKASRDVRWQMWELDHAVIIQYLYCQSK